MRLPIRAHLAEFGIVAPVGRNGVGQLIMCGFRFSVHTAGQETRSSASTPKGFFRTAAAASSPCLVDDVIATVNIKRFTGDEARRVVRQKSGGDANVVNADETACRRLCFCLVEQVVKFGNS